MLICLRNKTLITHITHNNLRFRLTREGHLRCDAVRSNSTDTKLYTKTEINYIDVPSKAINDQLYSSRNKCHMINVEEKLPYLKKGKESRRICVPILCSSYFSVWIKYMINYNSFMKIMTNYTITRTIDVKPTRRLYHTKLYKTDRQLTSQIYLYRIGWWYGGSWLFVGMVGWWYGKVVCNFFFSIFDPFRISRLLTFHLCPYLNTKAHESLERYYFERVA